MKGVDPLTHRRHTVVVQYVNAASSLWPSIMEKYGYVIIYYSVQQYSCYTIVRTRTAVSASNDYIDTMVAKCHWDPRAEQPLCAL